MDAKLKEILLEHRYSTSIKAECKCGWQGEQKDPRTYYVQWLAHIESLEPPREAAQPASDVALASSCFPLPPVTQNHDALSPISTQPKPPLTHICVHCFRENCHGECQANALAVAEPTPTKGGEPSEAMQQANETIRRLDEELERQTPLHRQDVPVCNMCGRPPPNGNICEKCAAPPREDLEVDGLLASIRACAKGIHTLPKDQQEAVVLSIEQSIAAHDAALRASVRLETLKKVNRLTDALFHISKLDEYMSLRNGVPVPMVSSAGIKAILAQYQDLLSERAAHDAALRASVRLETLREAAHLVRHLNFDVITRYTPFPHNPEMVPSALPRIADAIITGPTCTCADCRANSPNTDAAKETSK